MQRNILHLVLFALSKSAILIAPLIMATVLSKDDYGLIEWSLSISMMSSVFLSFGGGALISFELIKKDKSKIIDTTLFYNSFFIGFLAISGLFIFYFSDILILKYILAFSGMFMGQFILSSYIKAKGKGAYASFIESFTYIILLLLFLYALYYKSDPFNFFIVYYFISLIFALILNSMIKDKRILQVNDFIVSFKQGYPIMFASFLAIGFLNLPRILLGNEDSLSYVAEFTLYFRWAAIALVSYQFILVVNFRKIYTLSYEKLDIYFLMIAFMVLGLGTFIFLLINFLNSTNFSYFTLPTTNILLQVLMMSSIGLWSISTSFEGVFYREALTKYQFISSLIGIISFVLFYILFKYFTTDILLVSTLSWFLSYTIIVVTQVVFLKKKLHFKFTKIIFLLYFIIILVAITFTYEVLYA